MVPYDTKSADNLGEDRVGSQISVLKSVLPSLKNKNTKRQMSPNLKTVMEINSLSQALWIF